MLALVAALAHYIPHRCESPRKPIPPVRTRDDIGAMLRVAYNFTGHAAELGVQRGLFTRTLLAGWRQCDTFVQVDAWRALSNYQDVANVAADEQQSRRHEASEHGAAMVAAGHARRVEQCAGLTSECADRYPDGYFDFVYVDARHERVARASERATVHAAERVHSSVRPPVGALGAHAGCRARGCAPRLPRRSTRRCAPAATRECLTTSLAGGLSCAPAA